jgi:hypothetical protein
MTRTFLATAAAVVLCWGIADANELAIKDKTTFGKLDHVFLIMMENQTDTDILGNPNAPFINAYKDIANQATNYFAVGHPSAPNYLEIIGGSNFGLANDFWPVWIGIGCVDNAPGSTGCNGAFTAIGPSGLQDNAVVMTATSSDDCNGQISLGSDPPVPNNCALYTYNPITYTPKSIADQLVAGKKSWKTYQESLPTVASVPDSDQPDAMAKHGGAGGPAPLVSPFGINYADGAYSNLSPAQVFGPGPIQKLYAVKHNPFAYFANIEQGTNPALSMQQVVDFDGSNGLWADLQNDDGPNLWFIVPNQCHDMHGFVSGGTPICSTHTAQESDYLMLQGDANLNKLVTGIKSSPAWKKGRNAIVVVWDENDFSNSINRVILLVETNYASNGRKYNTAVDHFSLLRTMEAGFGLSCLNHACDGTSLILNTMFGGK